MHSSDEIKALVVEHMRSSRILANRIYEISQAAGASRPLPVGFRMYAALVPLADHYPRVQDGLFRALLGDVNVADPAVQASLEKLGERESRRAVLLWSRDRGRLRKALEAVRVFLDGLGFTPPDQAEYTTTVNNAILGANFHGFNFGLGGVSRSFSVHDAGREWDDRLADVLAIWGQVTKRSGLQKGQIILPQDLQAATDKAIHVLANGRIDRPSRDYLSTVLTSVQVLEQTVHDQILQCLSEPAICSQKQKCELIRDSLEQSLTAEDLQFVWQVAGNMGDSWSDNTVERGLSRMIQAGLLVHTLLQDARTTIESSIYLPLLPHRPHLRVIPQSPGPAGP
ncbi:MAG: hypothetical protein M1346_00465 [Gammaproteobacteria bacterium]|nr:hypothetical protein [Gammaproteobacteria bacterium]